MYAVSKFIVLLSAALCVTAIPSHFIRNPSNHHGLVARVASPEPIAEPIVVAEQRAILPPHLRRKRSPNGRCAVPSNSVSESSSTLPNSPTLVAKPPTTTTTSSSKKTQPTSTTSEAPPKSSTSSSSSGSSTSGVLSEILTGDGTYYATGLGACGITNSDTDMIAAASELLFDTFPGAGSNPNLNPICGRKVSVTYGGATITVAITDRCVACAYGALDFSPTAFQKLADLSVGRIHDIKWHFI